MLLLDSKAPSALLLRRFRVSERDSGQGGDVVRQVRVAVTLSAGEGGISLLCRAVSCCLVQARRSRSIRQASTSAWCARAAPTSLGSDLSAELRRSCSAGRR